MGTLNVQNSISFNINMISNLIKTFVYNWQRKSLLQVCFPKGPNSLAVWAWEMSLDRKFHPHTDEHTHVYTQKHAHMPATQEAQPALPTDSFINLDTNWYNQWAKLHWHCQSALQQLLTGYEKVRGQLGVGFCWESVWVVLVVYKKGMGLSVDFARTPVFKWKVQRNILKSQHPRYTGTFLLLDTEKVTQRGRHS